MNNGNTYLGEGENIEDISQTFNSIQELHNYVGRVTRQYFEYQGMKIPRTNGHNGENTSFYGHNDCLLNCTNVGYQLRRVIKRSLNKFFKKGLKNGEIITIDSEKKIIFTFCNPTNKSLKEVSEGKIKGVIAIELEVELHPRSKAHGDGGKFKFFYEIKVRDGKPNKSPYSFDASNPKKEKITTTERDESIERSRKAYRRSLMRVVTGF